MYEIIFLCMICCHVFLVVDTRSTICCICDDFSLYPSEKCQGDVCDFGHSFCDVCEYRRKFVGRTWYTTRTCSSESKCALDLNQTSTFGCIDNTRGEPAEGTTCYTCCKNEHKQEPFFCVDNIDTDGNTLPYTVSCEICLSGSCTNPRTMTCGNREQYCMNTVISDGVTTTVKKACATQTECYYDSYIAMKYKPECAGASGNTGNQSYVCHYCCEAKSGHLSACNTKDIPLRPAVYGQSGSTGPQVLIGR